MRPLFGLGAALILAAATVTACSGGSSGTTPCSTTTLPLPTLLYPIPGSAGVPDVAGNLLVAGVGPASGAITLSYGAGNPLQTAGLTATLPNPLPSPAATAPSGSTVEADGYPQLFAATTFTVVYKAFPASTCVNSQQSGTLGTFTTQ
jgi:hypothetical protein